jgi:predicted small lipoprotein YifL
MKPAFQVGNRLWLAVLLSLTCLAGCGVLRPLQVYPGDRKPDNKTAIVDIIHQQQGSVAYRVSLLAVDDRKFNPCLTPHEVSMMPGTHVLVFRRNPVNADLPLSWTIPQPDFVQTTVTLEAGHVYTAEDGSVNLAPCEPIYVSEPVPIEGDWFHRARVPATHKMLHRSQNPFNASTPAEISASAGS